MPTFKGTNKTIADAITPATILKPGLIGGNVRCMVDDYTVVGTEVTGDLIEMGHDLPVGAKILEVLLQTSALGSGVTLNVGDAEDDNRYISAVDCSGAIIVRMEAAEIAGRNYEITDKPNVSPYDSQIIVDVNAASTVLTASATIILNVYYTVE